MRKPNWQPGNTSNSNGDRQAGLYLLLAFLNVHVIHILKIQNIAEPCPESPRSPCTYSYLAYAQLSVAEDNIDGSQVGHPGRIEFAFRTFKTKITFFATIGTSR